MPKWLRTWLICSAVYLCVHLLFGTLLCWGAYRPWALPFGALAFGGIMSWFQAVRDRPRPP